MKFLVAGEMAADIVATIGRSDIHLPGDDIPAETIELKCGGDALNNSINLSKLGCSVAFIGKYGNDVFGDTLVDYLNDAGVNVDFMARSENTPSTKTLALLDGTGGHVFITCKGSNSELSLSDFNHEAMKQFDHLHIGGVFHLDSLDGEGCVNLLKRAKQLGLNTSMDVSWDYSGRWGRTIAGYYPYLDFFLPSISEAYHITGMEDPVDIAEYFASRGVKTVVIKLGGKGCYCKTADRSFYCSAYKVDPVDTVGAGDSFVAGFLAAKSQELPIEECVQWGSACAAITIQSVGATAGSPTLAEMKQFLKESPKLEVTYESKK